MHCEAKAGIKAAPSANEARKVASLVMCSIKFVTFLRDVRVSWIELAYALAHFGMRLSQCHRQAGRLARMNALAGRMWGDICDNSVQEGGLWVRYGHCVELTALFRRSALTSTRDPQCASPPETLRSLRH
jgi:hypothetical protein